MNRTPANASPTQRTLTLLREEGYTVAVVEHWNAHAKCRQDLFSWIDIVALGEGELLGVQVTTATNLAARIRKAKALPAYAAWQRAGGKAVFHGWRKPTASSPIWSLRQEVDP